MDTYISKLISALPVAQRTALRSLMTKGAVQSGDYSLESLLKSVEDIVSKNTGSQPLPLLEATGSVSNTGSRYFNHLFNLLKLDLTSVYDELDNIGLIYEQLNRLNESDEASIERRLQALDDMLTVVEILSENEQERYKVTSYNTFNSATSRSLDLGHPYANAIYQDPRTRQTVSAGNILSVDVGQEGAILPIKQFKKTPAQSIYLSAGTNTTETDYDLTTDQRVLKSIPDNQIANLENQYRQAWGHFVFLEKTTTRQRPPLSTSAEVIIDFGGLTTVNSIYFVPVTSAGINISSILYEGADGQIYTITDTDLLINSATSIVFAKKIASKLYINFVQSNYQTLQTILELATDSPYSRIPEYIVTNNSSPAITAIREEAGLPTKSFKKLNGWLYTFGLQELSAGTVTYKDYGLHASEVLSLDSPLYKVAVNSNVTYSQDAFAYKGESIEYWIYKLDLDKSGNVIQTNTFPILPIGQTTIDHEQLIINSSGLGTIMFFPDMTESLAVYRNFTALELGTDYLISVDRGETYEAVYPASVAASGLPYVFMISINDPKSESVYTVSYSHKTLELASGYPLYLDSNGSAVLYDDNSIVFNYAAGQRELVVSTKFALMIIIRSLNHQAYLRETPIIFDYTLFGG